METRLLSVLWWFCASILIGILIVLAFDFVLEIPLPVSESLGLVVGPTVVMVVIAILRHGLDVPGIVRRIGAVAGWLSFVSLYLQRGVQPAPGGHIPRRRTPGPDGPRTSRPRGWSPQGLFCLRSSFAWPEAEQDRSAQRFTKCRAACAQDRLSDAIVSPMTVEGTRPGCLGCRPEAERQRFEGVARDCRRGRHPYPEAPTFSQTAFVPELALVVLRSVGLAEYARLRFVPPSAVRPPIA